MGIGRKALINAHPVENFWLRHCITPVGLSLLYLWIIATVGLPLLTVNSIYDTTKVHRVLLYGPWIRHADNQHALKSDK